MSSMVERIIDRIDQETEAESQPPLQLKEYVFTCPECSDIKLEFSFSRIPAADGSELIEGDLTFLQEVGDKDNPVQIPLHIGYYRRADRPNVLHLGMQTPNIKIQRLKRAIARYNEFVQEYDHMLDELRANIMLLKDTIKSLEQDANAAPVLDPADDDQKVLTEQDLNKLIDALADLCDQSRFMDLGTDDAYKEDILAAHRDVLSTIEDLDSLIGDAAELLNELREDKRAWERQKF